MAQVPSPPTGGREPGYVQQPVYVQQQGNGMAVASLVLGLVGTVMGFIPFLFFIALICGVLAVVFGFVGIRKAGRGASGKGMAIAGLVLGLVALALGVAGVVITGNAVEEIDRIINSPNP